MIFRKLSLLVSVLAVLFFTSCIKSPDPRTQAMEDAEINELLYNLIAEGNDVDTAYVDNVPFYYMVEETGTGPNVAYGDSLVIKYEITKLNLIRIASSENFENEQWKFLFTRETEFFTGFREALFLTRKDATMVFILPSKLAYGEYGIPGFVEPYETILLGLQIDDVISTAE